MKTEIKNTMKLVDDVAWLQNVTNYNHKTGLYNLLLDNDFNLSLHLIYNNIDTIKNVYWVLPSMDDETLNILNYLNINLFKNKLHFKQKPEWYGKTYSENMELMITNTEDIFKYINSYYINNVTSNITFVSDFPNIYADVYNFSHFYENRLNEDTNKIDNLLQKISNNNTWVLIKEQAMFCNNVNVHTACFNQYLLRQVTEHILSIKGLDSQSNDLVEDINNGNKYIIWDRPIDDDIIGFDILFKTELEQNLIIINPTFYGVETIIDKIIETNPVESDKKLIVIDSSDDINYIKLLANLVNCCDVDNMYIYYYDHLPNFMMALWSIILDENHLKLELNINEYLN